MQAKFPELGKEHGFEVDDAEQQNDLDNDEQEQDDLGDEAEQDVLGDEEQEEQDDLGNDAPAEQDDLDNEEQEEEEADMGTDAPAEQYAEEDGDGTLPEDEHLYDGRIEYADDVLPTDPDDLHTLLKYHDAATRSVRFHMRELGLQGMLKHLNPVRGGITEKAQDLIRLVHTGTLTEVLDFAYSREGVKFADAAEQRLGKFQTRQDKHRGKATGASWQSSSWHGHKHW